MLCSFLRVFCPNEGQITKWLTLKHIKNNWFINNNAFVRWLVQLINNMPQVQGGAKQMKKQFHLNKSWAVLGVRWTLLVFLSSATHTISVVILVHLVVVWVFPKQQVSECDTNSFLASAFYSAQRHCSWWEH